VLLQAGDSLVSFHENGVAWPGPVFS
jgi:hypothetical protein